MNRLITSLIVVLAATNLSAQQMAELPKLVVGITVDQLRSDYINYLYEAFGEDGFKQLMEKGLVYEDLEFDLIQPDGTSTMATLMTGAYPSHHGVISQTLFDPQTLSVRPVLQNPKTSRFTAKDLLASTISDELKIATHGIARAYAIAPNADQAILAAGHAADGAFWISSKTGKWTSAESTEKQPFFIDHYNRSQSLSDRLHTESWEPLLPLDAYQFMPYSLRDWGFKHHFIKGRKPAYANFKTSAKVNEEVNRMAEVLLQQASLGKDQSPDFLGITYYAGNYQDGSDLPYDLEMQDTYLRLDQSLGKLLAMIDQTVGLDKTLIYLTSTGYFNQRELPGEEFNIPTGKFYPDRCLALLNTYLMAFYGNAEWVTGYHNQQIYLNKDAIRDHKVSLAEIQAHAAEFVSEFSGVKEVVTGSDLKNPAKWNDRLKTYKNSYHKEKSGDLLVTLDPGWQIVYDNLHQQHTQSSLEKVATPLIIWGEGIPAKKIGRPIDATELAPTVARILRIRSPNASSAQPLAEVSKSE